MPNVSSWNGKWSGEGKPYFIIKTVTNEKFRQIMRDAETHSIYEGFFERKKVGEIPLRKSYYYNFRDGWGASITVEHINSKEASKRRKISNGFCGYDWMVESILMYDEILNSIQRKELKIQQNKSI